MGQIRSFNAIRKAVLTRSRVRLVVGSLLLSAMWLVQTQPGSAEQIKRIELAVPPYYQSAETPDGLPKVSVGQKFDALLASNKRADIIAVSKQIQSDNKFVTPMVLMALAIRLYDVGLRDDSVFWFYVAKDRLVAMASVLDAQTSALASIVDVMRRFVGLAGPTINGYAFCDLARQDDLRRRSLAWMDANPYDALLTVQLPALPGDRKENLHRAVDAIKASADREREILKLPQAMDEMRKARKAAEADEKFCWK